MLHCPAVMSATATGTAHRLRAGTALWTLALAFTALLAVLRLGGAGHFLSSGLAAIRYPFELDFGEGVVLNQTKLLMSGQSLYRPVDRPPFLITVYPPVFHALTAAADILVGNTLATGRSLSLGSATLAAVIIGILVWLAIGAEANALARGLPALVAGLGFLNVSYTASWAPLMRIDLVAHLLALCGVVVFVILAPRGNRASWSAVPFLLAVYTRQSTIAAPAACLIVALLVRPALAVRLAAWLAGLGLATFTVINRLTAGQFYFQAIRGQETAYDWHRLLWNLSDLRLRYPIEIAVALVATRSLLRGLRHAEAPQPLRPMPFNWTRPVLGVYLFTAFLVSLTVGKVGSEVNYLVEFMGVVCACAGVALGDALAAAAPRRFPRERVLRASVSALLLSALLLAPALGVPRGPAIEWVEIPSLAEQAEMQRLVALVHQVDGPVLSQMVTPLVLAGKPVEYQSCDALEQLARLGWWNPSALIARIERQEYRLIILGFDVSKPRDWSSFTPPMIEAIRRRYAASDVIAGFWIYRPR